MPYGSPSGRTRSSLPPPPPCPANSPEQPNEDERSCVEWHPASACARPPSDFRSVALAAGWSLKRPRKPSNAGRHYEGRGGLCVILGLRCYENTSVHAGAHRTVEIQERSQECVLNLAHTKRHRTRAKHSASGAPQDHRWVNQRGCSCHLGGQQQDKQADIPILLSLVLLLLLLCFAGGGVKNGYPDGKVPGHFLSV